MNNSRNQDASALQPRTLVDAVIDAASARGHTHAKTARFLGVTDVHWYRLRKRPHLLAKCERPLLRRVAIYVGWPLLNVYVASGILDWEDVPVAIHTTQTVRRALKQIVRTPLGAAIKTPLDNAAVDHQMLIALLFLTAQECEVWKLMQAP